MRSIEVRKLKKQTDEILRWLQEQGEEIEITQEGRPIARLVPVEASPSTAQILQEFDALAAEVGKHWPKDVSALEAVQEVRREL